MSHLPLCAQTFNISSVRSQSATVSIFNTTLYQNNAKTFLSFPFNVFYLWFHNCPSFCNYISFSPSILFPSLSFTFFLLFIILSLFLLSLLCITVTVSVLLFLWCLNCSSTLILLWPLSLSLSLFPEITFHFCLYSIFCVFLPNPFAT